MSNQNIDRAAWLAARKTGIGGSDISVLAGVNKYRSEFQLWLDKTGRSDDDSAANSEAAHFGSVLEAVVADEYALRTGRRVQRVNSIMRAGVAMANIDRAVVADGRRARWNGSQLTGADRLLECKTAHALAAGNGDEWGDEGTDQVPMAYFLQCQWYMAITGVPICDLAVLFGGQKFRIYEIRHDADLTDSLMAMAGAWWQRHIIDDTPPDPTTATECRQRWHTNKPETAVEISAAAASAAAELKRLKAEIRDLGEIADRYETALLAEIGTAETATHGGQIVATWKNNKDTIVTNYKAVIAALGDDDRLAELIDNHTTARPGARVLRIK